MGHKKIPDKQKEWNIQNILLAVGIIVLMANWTFLIIHNVDYQLAKNADLDKTWLPALLISTCICAAIFVAWFMQQRDNKIELKKILISIGIIFIIVNFVLKFIIEKDIESLNATLDKSAIQIVEKLVDSKYIEHRGGEAPSEYYYILLRDRDNGKFSLYVNYDFYKNIEKENKIRLYIKPGYFGWPWITKFEKI